MLPPNSKISNDGSRCVDTEARLYHPDEYPPPRGVDLLILTKWGVLIKGKWDDVNCAQWHPILKRSKYKPSMIKE